MADNKLSEEVITNLTKGYENNIKAAEKIQAAAEINFKNKIIEQYGILAGFDSQDQSLVGQYQGFSTLSILINMALDTRVPESEIAGIFKIARKLPNKDDLAEIVGRIGETDNLPINRLKLSLSEIDKTLLPQDKRFRSLTRRPYLEKVELFLKSTTFERLAKRDNLSDNFLTAIDTVLSHLENSSKSSEKKHSAEGRTLGICTKDMLESIMYHFEQSTLPENGNRLFETTYPYAVDFCEPYIYEGPAKELGITDERLQELVDNHKKPSGSGVLPDSAKLQKAYELEIY